MTTPDDEFIPLQQAVDEAIDIRDATGVEALNLLIDARIRELVSAGALRFPDRINP